MIDWSSGTVWSRCGVDSRVRRRIVRRDPTSGRCRPRVKGRRKTRVNERIPCRTRITNNKTSVWRYLGTWQKRSTTDGDWTPTGRGVTGAGSHRRPSHVHFSRSYVHSRSRKRRCRDRNTLGVMTTGTENWRNNGKRLGSLYDGRTVWGLKISNHIVIRILVTSRRQVGRKSNSLTVKRFSYRKG